MNSKVDLGAPPQPADADKLAAETQIDLPAWQGPAPERKAFLEQFDAEPRLELPLPAGEPAASAIVAASPTPQWLGRHFPMGQWVRRGGAVALIGVLLWWLVLPFLFPVTSQAVVNARTVPVRTPIDGACVELDRDIGDTLTEGDPLMRVACPRIDTSRLAGLKTRNAELTAHRTRLINERAAGVVSLSASRETTECYREAIFASLHASIDEGLARAAGKRVQSEASQRRLERQLSLQSRGAASIADIDDARESMEHAGQSIEEDEAVLRRLREEMKAAENGVFLQKDALLHQLRSEELVLKDRQLKAELQETEALIAAVESELSTEQESVDRMGEARATAPVSGIVWKRHGCPGQELRKSDTVYEIADRNSIFVEALFHQRYLASAIAPGCQATIKLTSGKTLQGKVRAVRTLGAAKTEAAFALNLASDDLKQVRVLIELPSEVQDANLIGRHVRVLITDENPGIVQMTVSWLFARLGV